MLAAMTTRRQIIGVVFLVLIGLGFIGGGVYQIWQQRTGTEAQATVRSCQQARRSFVCRGSWTTGSLLEGGGFREYVTDVFALDVLEGERPLTRRVQCEDLGRSLQPIRQVVDRDLGTAADDDGMCQYVGELSHVSGPAIASERCFRRRL